MSDKVKQAIERRNNADYRCYEALQQLMDEHGPEIRKFIKKLEGGSLDLVNNVEAALKERLDADRDLHKISTAELSVIRMLERITEKVARANAIQHSGKKISSEDWSELYSLQNEAKSVIESAKSSR